MKKTRRAEAVTVSVATQDWSAAGRQPGDRDLQRINDKLDHLHRMLHAQAESLDHAHVMLHAQAEAVADIAAHLVPGSMTPDQVAEVQKRLTNHHAALQRLASDPNVPSLKKKP